MAKSEANKLRNRLDTMAKKDDDIGFLAGCVSKLDQSARRDAARLKALEALLYKKFAIKIPDADSIF